MSLIEYHEGTSFLHRMDPRVKLILLVTMTIGVFMTKNFYLLASVFVFVILLWILAALPLQRILSYVKFLLLITLFITLLQAVFVEGETVLLHPIIPAGVPLIGGAGTIYLDGVLNGLLLGFRLLTVMCMMPVVIMTTPIDIMSLGLVKMGLNYQIAYMATTALNLIPTFQSEAETIMDAQKMRGLSAFEKGGFLQKFKAYVPLAVPLVVGAMRKAQMMGVSMDSRAFGCTKTRTYREDITFARSDFVFLAVGLALSILVIALNFVF